MGKPVVRLPMGLLADGRVGVYGFSGCLNAGGTGGSLKRLPRGYGLPANRVLAFVLYGNGCFEAGWG